MGSLKCKEEEDSQQQFGRDLICETASRMPAKSAIKMLSLSKSTWTTLPSNPFFVEKQSTHSSRSDGGFFLQPSTEHKLEFHALETPSSFGISHTSLSFLKQSNIRVQDSTHGLLLCSMGRYKYTTFKLLICNPATRRRTYLPSPEYPIRYNPDGILLFCPPTRLNAPTNLSTHITVIATHYRYVDASSLSTLTSGIIVYRNGIWVEVTTDLRIPQHRIRLDMPVGLFTGCNGGIQLHILCDSIPSSIWGYPVYEKPYIVIYDIDRKGYSRTLSLPEDAWKEEEDCRLGSYCLRMFKWRCGSSGWETLGVLRTDKGLLRVWLMEDYEEGRWRRVLMKTPAEIGLPDEDGTVKGCCVMNGTELVFATKRRVYVYHMEGPNAGRLQAVADHQLQHATELVLTPYANTVRPVGSGRSCVRTRRPGYICSSVY